MGTVMVCCRLDLVTIELFPNPNDSMKTAGLYVENRDLSQKEQHPVNTSSKLRIVS